MKVLQRLDGMKFTLPKMGISKMYISSIQRKLQLFTISRMFTSIIQHAEAEIACMQIKVNTVQSTFSASWQWEISAPTQSAYNLTLIEIQSIDDVWVTNFGTLKSSFHWYYYMYTIFTSKWVHI